MSVVRTMVDVIGSVTTLREAFLHMWRWIQPEWRWTPVWW